MTEPADRHQGCGPARLPNELREDVLTLWDYNQMHHELRLCDVGIGLGSHDPTVPTYTAELYHRGLFPRIVFTGANAPTTVDRYPRGEAFHYREAAIRLGVPQDAIFVEPLAKHTGENITLTRDLLHREGIEASSVMLISRPYQQRRAYATCRKQWPAVHVICASAPLSLDDYVATLGDPERIMNMLVGDTSRISEYAIRGFAIPQPVPPEVTRAQQALIRAGFTSRIPTYVGIREV